MATFDGAERVTPAGFGARASLYPPDVPATTQHYLMRGRAVAGGALVTWAVEDDPDWAAEEAPVEVADVVLLRSWTT